MSRNLFLVLNEACQGSLDKTFLSLPANQSLTYGDFFKLAESYALALKSCGVSEGDRVLVKTKKSSDALALYLGCLQLGAVYIPVNPRSTQHEIDYFVNDADPAIVIFDPNEDISVGIRSETIGDGGTLTLMAASAAQEVLNASSSTSDIAAMLYTSGTTGRPKGALLSHRALISNGIALNNIWAFKTDDVLLHCLPVFHVHGLFVAIHCAMLSGSTVIFREKFSVTEVTQLLQKSTVFMGVPTYYTRLLSSNSFNSTVCSGMRLFTSGSAPMTEQTHKNFYERTGHQIVERYGMTEAGIIASNPLEGKRIPGSVGFRLPGMDLRIAIDGRACGTGENGVVEVKGDHLFSGYWRKPEQTAEAFQKDGFLITGDIGNLDDDGRLRLEGRSTDLIISGGENVYPKEIEICLDDFDTVLEAAVIGVPHPDLGEAVVAVLVADGSLSIQELKDYVVKRLTSLKQPKEYFVISELPRNTMGKVQKSKIRASYSALFTKGIEGN